MKSTQSYSTLLVLLLVLSALPTMANAEIYKWKDKDGSIRYADTPPPSNIKQESISGKRTTKATNQAPLAPVANVTGKDAMPAKETAAKAESTEEVAAKLRQKNAETEKNNKKEKEAEAKLNAENCKAAKSNLASYQQGGRIYKVNEKGEREYLDDAGLKAGADKAQKEVSEYCNG